MVRSDQAALQLVFSPSHSSVESLDLGFRPPQPTAMWLAQIRCAGFVKNAISSNDRECHGHIAEIMPLGSVEFDRRKPVFRIGLNRSMVASSTPSRMRVTSNFSATNSESAKTSANTPLPR